ncbi:MAG: TPM domain-containing protein [Zoogloeaceae bacterium]|nr:TPM domain-containing protein [Zoogloeaceae bacterium]
MFQMKKNLRRMLASLYLFCMFFAVPAFAEVTYPEHKDNYVNDFASVLSANHASAIRDSLQKLQRETGIQMVVVTVNAVSDYGAGATSVPVFAANLFDHWGISDKTQNSGILIFLSLKDREVKIEMGKGYAHRYDAEMQSIVDSTMIPRFKQDDYSGGIYDGVHAVIDTVTRQVSWFSYYKWHILVSVLIVVCIFAGISCMKSGKKGWGWAFFALAGALLLFLLKLLLKRSGSSSGYGGGSSGGGGGGGKF